MAFSFGRTCILVAVLILTAFVFVAMSFGHRELFSGGSYKSYSLKNGKDTYKYIDEDNKGVCYPGEHSVRSPLSDEEPCTSHRFQNPAYFTNQIRLGDGTASNPLSLVKFANNKTLEDELLSPHIKTQVEKLLENQNKNYDQIVGLNQLFKDKLDEVTKLNESLENVRGYNVKKVSASIKRVQPTQVPSLRNINTQSPCNGEGCTYQPFSYNTNTYGRIGNGIVTRKIPSTTAIGERAMYIANVQSPKLMKLPNTCP